MRRVVAYGDMESLISSDLYKEIEDCIHLAESANMKEMLKKSEYFSSVHLFRDIIDKLDFEWTKEKQRIHCLTLISVCIKI